MTSTTPVKRETCVHDTTKVAAALATLEHSVDSATPAQLNLMLVALIHLTTRVGAHLDVDVQKKMHEITYAAETGYTLSQAQGGADLTDAAGNAIEQKTTVVRRVGAHQNVNIKIPSQRETETQTQFAERASADVVRKGDVHIKYLFPRDTSKTHVVVLPVELVAGVAHAMVMRTSAWKRMRNINLGGPVCTVCMRCHRTRALEQEGQKLRAGETVDFAAIVARSVSRFCAKQSL